MRVTITTDAGEFTAESIKEAKRIERREKAAEAKRLAEVSRKRDAAKGSADGRAMTFVRFAFETDHKTGGPRTMPPGYRYHSGDGGRGEPLEAGEVIGWKTDTYKIEVDGQRAELGDMYGVKVVGWVENSGGVALLHLADRHDSTNVFFAATGVFEGVAVLSFIPAAVGLTADRFVKSSRVA